MPVYGDSSWENGLDSCFLIKKDGTQIPFDGLATTQITDDCLTDGKCNEAIANISSDMEFSMEIKQTHKQARQTKKFFNSLENNMKRKMRRYKRLKEKVRRYTLQGRSQQFIRSMVHRSKYVASMKIYHPSV